MSLVNAPGEALAEMNAREAQFDIDALFRAHYRRVARMIARVVRDPARAEELAVEVFLRLWRNSSAQGEHVEGWLYRVALRAGLDELRRQSRRSRYERLLSLVRSTPPPSTPEQLHSATEQQERVRSILSALPKREAEFLVLRSHGFSYEEVALTLNINPSSVGTLLSRAQQSFRKEFIKRYGHE
jgi:RNA polymerase sigma-70 factor (ECF subfamily)